MTAAVLNKSHSVEVLLTKGADKFMKDEEGKTAEDWAQARGYKQLSAKLKL